MVVKVCVLFLSFLIGTLAVSTPNANRDYQCKHVDQSARIAGGTPAADGSVPYMAAITTGFFVRSFFCGGSIIGARTILTAAHCIDVVYNWGTITSSLQAVVGTNFWNSGGQFYPLIGNVTHPNYVRATIKNDLGFLYTSRDIVYSATVASVTISYDFVQPGVVGRVAGWGITTAGGFPSAALLELSPTVINTETCALQVAAVGQIVGFTPPPVEGHIELCTSDSPENGACSGDSGSALVRRDNNQQIGIVSWGVPCANGAPDVFVRLSAFQSFIEANTI